MNILTDFFESDFFYYLSKLSEGLPITLSLSFLAILFAFIFALFLSISLTLNINPWLRKLINGFIVVFTGTPLYVQILLIYSVIPFINNNIITLPSGAYDVLKSAYLAALVALTLNSAAYSTQLFYGTFKAIPSGYKEACETLGMSKSQMLKVIIPYGLIRALSSYSNEIIFVVKGSAIASTITLMDVTGYFQKLIGEYYNLEILVAAAFIYLVINLSLSLLMRIIEYFFSSFERPNA